MRLLTVLAILFILPISANADCVRPFVSSNILDSEVKSAGLTLPFSSNLFRYANCSKNDCLMMIEIIEGENVTSTAILQNLPNDTDSDFLSGEAFEKIAVDRLGNGVYAAAVKVEDGIYIRADFVKNRMGILALHVEHQLHNNYPKIEKLQAFIRQNIVVCN